MSRMESRHSSLGASPSEGLGESPRHAPPTRASPQQPPQQQQQPPPSRPAKAHAQIKIEPNCLVFPPPHYGRCIQNAISVYNVSKQPCVFKMRSQNPERYVAKPHVAIIAPESATRIFVTLRDMNTLGMKNVAEDTQDRFRLSLRLYDPATVSRTLPAKELWAALAATRGSKVDHEQDLVAYFVKRDTPVGGLVTFFPPTYIPVTPTAASAKAAAAAAAAASSSSMSGDGPASPRGGVAGDARATPAGGAAGRTGAAKGRRGLYVGVVVAAMMVLSVAVMLGRVWGATSARAEAALASQSPPAAPLVQRVRPHEAEESPQPHRPAAVPSSAQTERPAKPLEPQRQREESPPTAASTPEAHAAPQEVPLPPAQEHFESPHEAVRPSPAEEGDAPPAHHHHHEGEDAPPHE